MFSVGFPMLSYVVPARSIHISDPSCGRPGLAVADPRPSGEAGDGTTRPSGTGWW